MTHASVEARAIEFLNESNAIDDITAIDYAVPANRVVGSGHFGAFVRMQSLAQERRPLSLEELCSWQALITEEQIRHGHPLPHAYIGRLRGSEAPVDARVGSYIAPAHDQVEPLLRQWLEDANQHTRTVFSEREDTVQAIADTLLRFEVIHPFVDGNGRVGRLVANWVALQKPLPIIVFRKAEREAFYASHRSKIAMRAFIIEKVREVFFYMRWSEIFSLGGENTEEALRQRYFQYGQIAFRQSSMGSTDVYKTASGVQVLIEHHDLLDALKRWQAEDT